MNAETAPKPKKVRAKSSPAKKTTTRKKRSTSSGKSTAPKAQASQPSGFEQDDTTGTMAAVAQGNLTLATSHALSEQAHSAELGQMQSDMQLQTVTTEGLNALFGTPVRSES